MNPSDVLKEGCRILDPIMRSHGFALTKSASGKGSGGNFAMCEYARGDRRMELHFRFSLGMVRYHVGTLSVSHESYMQELLGSGGSNQYPGFSDDPLDGFRHLAHDLQHYCQNFLSGDASELARTALKESADETAQQRIDMAGAVGDTRRREEAREHFRQKNYEKVVEQLEGIKYLEFLTESERKMLEMSKRRLK